MNTIYFILILQLIKFAIINAAGGQGETCGSGSGRKRPSEQIAESAGGNDSDGEGADDLTVAPIYKIGLFEKTADPNKAKCLECNKDCIISRGNISNLTQHLYKCHKDKYAEKFETIKQQQGSRALLSPLWDPEFFTKNVKNNTVQCATCKHTFNNRKGGSTGNLITHLENRHEDLHKKFVELTKKRNEERSQRRLRVGSISKEISQNIPASSNVQQHHGQSASTEEMAPFIFESSNHPQQHSQMELQQNDPNVVQTLAREVASAFSGQMVPSATLRDQQTVQQLPISRTQEMLQHLHVSSNQPRQQYGYAQHTGMLRLSQQSINQIQQQRQSRLSQHSLVAEQMPPSMSQQMQPSTMSARPSRHISILNNLSNEITRQRTLGQGSRSGFQQHLSQLDKGKGIMTEEHRTQSRPSERTFMGDAIRAERTSQLRQQSISQFQQSATQAGQLANSTIMHRPSTFAHGRATESYGSGHTHPLQSLSTASQFGHQSLSQQYQQMATQTGQTAAPLRSDTMPPPSTLTQGIATHQLQSLSGGTQFGQPTSSFGTGGSHQNIPPNTGYTGRGGELAMLTGMFSDQRSSAAGTQPATGLTTNRATGGRLFSIATAYGQTTQHQPFTNIDHQHENTGRDGELAMLTDMFSDQSPLIAGTQPPIGLTTNRATEGRLSSLATEYGQASQHPSSGEQYGQGTHRGASGSITRPSLLAGGGTTRPSSFTQLAPLPSATQTQHYGQGTYGEAGGSITRPSSFTGLAPLPPSLSIPSTEHHSNQTVQQESSTSDTQPPYHQSNFGPDHY